MQMRAVRFETRGNADSDKIVIRFPRQVAPTHESAFAAAVESGIPAENDLRGDYAGDKAAIGNVISAFSPVAA